MEVREPPWPPSARYLQVDGVLVDLRGRRLWRDGQKVELQQRIFDLLLVLMSAPYEPCSRSELFARLWPGLVVDDANISQNVWLLRKSLGDSRRDWIRTVAKRGYVFEPPSPLQWHYVLPPPWSDEAPPLPEPADGAGTQADAQRSDAAEPAAPASTDVPVSSWPTVPAAAAAAPVAARTPAPDTSTPGPPAAIPPATPTAAPPPRAARRRRRRWIGAAALAVAVVALAIWLWPRTPPPAQTLRVALIDVSDRDDSAAWAGALLREWLKWKLDALPEVDVVAPAEAMASSARIEQVFVSAAGAADGRSLSLRVRIEGDGQRPQSFETSGAPAHAAALADTLSAKAMSRLLPARRDAWPALRLSADAARSFVAAADALERRDWMLAAQRAGDAVQQAPQFGPARLYLARALSALSRNTEAVRQIELAQTLLRPVPAGVAQSLRAQALAMDPARYGEAIDAYRALVARYPHNQTIALELAQLWLRDDRPKQARLALERAGLDLRAPPEQVRYFLIQSQIEWKLGDSLRAERFARSAERAARRAGPKWTLERADALATIAGALYARGRERESLALYAQVAELYRRAGNATGALVANAAVEVGALRHPPDYRRLDEIVERAHRGGNHNLEAAILIAVFGWLGEDDERVARAEQARQEAVLAGDTSTARRLDLLLVEDDYLQLRLDRADVRIRRLLQGDAHGAVTSNAYGWAGSASFSRGEFAAAERYIARALATLAGEGGAQSADTSMYRCNRAYSRLRGGDLAEARSSWIACSASTKLTNRIGGWMIGAQVELYQGQPAIAARLTEAAARVAGARTVQAKLDVRQRLSLAEALTRLGQGERSQRVYAEVRALPGLQPRYRVLLGLGEAEDAALGGRWAQARSSLQQALAGLPAQEWTLRVRAEVLAIAIDLGTGQAAEALRRIDALQPQAAQRGDWLLQRQLRRLRAHADARLAGLAAPTAADPATAWLERIAASPSAPAAVVGPR